MNTHTDAAILVGEMRPQPFSRALNIFQRRIGQDEGALRERFHFDETRNSDIANLPAVHACSEVHSNVGSKTSLRVWRYANRLCSDTRNGLQTHRGIPAPPISVLGIAEGIFFGR